MFVQMRRALPGPGRGLLTPVLLVLAVASVGAIAQNITTHRNQDAYPAPGMTYSVGDHRLHLDCHGTGRTRPSCSSTASARSPHPGPGSPARLDGTTRVCAYDRAGQAWSDDVDAPQDGVDGCRGPPPPSRQRRRRGSLRPRRALHRRPVRHDLRRAVPRPGRRHGAPGQLQPPPAHRHPELPAPVRRDATRLCGAAHARAAGSRWPLRLRVRASRPRTGIVSTR